MNITLTVTFIGNSMKNANLNPREIVIFLIFANINTCENIYVHVYMITIDTRKCL